MAKSGFYDAYKRYRLDYRPAVDTDPPYVEVSLEPAGFVLLQQYGADPARKLFRARMLNPTRVPYTFVQGTTGTLEYNGQQGRVTVEGIEEKRLEVLDDELGQKFVLSWVARG